MIFINCSIKGKVETIDYFDTYKEAKINLKEYRIIRDYSNAYLSRRATKDFYREMKESKK